VRILKFMHIPYPWDVRAEKILRGLARNGDEVALVSPPGLNGDGASIEFPNEHYPVGISGREGTDILTRFPVPWSSIWMDAANTAISGGRPDVILARDLVVWPLSYRIGSRLRIPVVYDMAEHYPEMLEHRFRHGLGAWKDRILRNPSFWRAVERFCLERSDAILTVCEASREYLVRERGVPAGKVYLVRNTPDPGYLDAIPNQRTGIGPIRIAYLGFLDPSRDLELLIRRWPDIEGELGTCEFLIAGGGISESRLRGIARESRCSDRIRFLGEVPYLEGLRILASADIGVIPLRATSHTLKTVPNKIFEYMMLELPVLASDLPPMVSILEETGAGLSYRTDDPADLVEKIGRLKDPGVRKGMGAKGRAAVLGKYNFTEDATQLTGILQRVAEHAHSPVGPGRM
jgi:glycosyltransferase involved in cell wall biosynthesis